MHSANVQIDSYATDILILVLSDTEGVKQSIQTLDFSFINYSSDAAQLVG